MEEGKRTVEEGRKGRAGRGRIEREGKREGRKERENNEKDKASYNGLGIGG